MKKSIISICLLLHISLVFANTDSTKMVYDKSSIESRTFDEDKINEHKADSDYDYGNREVEGLSAWDRFKIWLSRVLSKIFSFGMENPFGKTIIYILCGAVIVYAILKYLKLDVRKVFYANPDKGNIDYSVFEEDIHEMDFEKLIQEAIDNKEYRNAIRLIYLYALRNLSDNQMISWEPGKTNYDYVDEVQDKQLRKGFSELSFYFDYAWYGDFNITQQLFEKVNDTFSHWKKELPA